ncbi:ribonuclease TUDOR 2-like [Chenopodium quinoa]|uniref:ribonuclease TUDOR 2-like n=1 Tax=Chenopodium quinoa TaxID=63459 RepID=UPI000B7745AA|nr:ribonuclease TUDOR 2-like [Chenopodium quinoa]XP_021721223.1 ribonuclease TUDOR 2-like [Chenopodium quinoa]XP_021721227.1 ribonuclease TUDOR 2-like [Chenopodium quinoa]
MAAGQDRWLRGMVKAVPSGDTLVIMGIAKKDEIPPEKAVILKQIIAPRLARRDGEDEPFAWESREYLRKLCIGKEVVFKTESNTSAKQIPGREFASVMLADGSDVAKLVVQQGWAKVKTPSKNEANSDFTELLALEEKAKQQGLGKWSEVPGASEASIRNLPPSAMDASTNFDVVAFTSENKGRSLQAVVEQVRDGSTLRVYLLPEFQYVQVFVAGIQCPSMGRRPFPERIVEAEVSTDGPNGEAATEPRAPLTAAQKVAASAAPGVETPADPFGREAKHFTETRTLHRDVRIVLEQPDRLKNLVGSVYYDDGGEVKNLALELVKNGLAKYLDWSAKSLEAKDQKELKTAELEAKKKRIKMWTNYVPPATNSKAIHDQNFTGKVVEIVSGDCIIVADDAVPVGSPLAERRVNISSIKAPKLGNPRWNNKGPESHARESKEFLRQKLIGRQVNVSMEYSRKVPVGGGAENAAPSSEFRVMDFGSVFLPAQSKGKGGDATSASSTVVGQENGYNVAELLVGRGLATVVPHRDFEERSNYYDALLVAEVKAKANRKGVHGEESPTNHIQDLTTASGKKAKDFLPFLKRVKRHSAVVEYVLSGHRFKLLLPKATCSIAFSFSGVRCPGRGEPYSDDAIAFMRRRIMQRDVEIEVETVDRTGTFLGSLWESKINMAAVLLEAGLAKFQKSFGTDRIADAHLLAQAEESAKRQKLKIWENYVEGQEVVNGSSAPENRQKEVMKVVVTEVLGGGKFYVQKVEDQMVASIQQQLASLDIKEAPVIGSFNPKKGDVVLAQFSADNSWNRAMIVNVPRGDVQSPKDEFEVFYIDYGNQEVLPYSRLRPLPPSVLSVPGSAQLCTLAFVKVPSLEEDYGQEAAEYLSELTLNSSREFRAMVEEKDTSGGKSKGQGSGTVLLVTLVDVEASSSINAAMLKVGLARLEKLKRWDSVERKSAIDNLEEFQEEAKKSRSGMWQYGDVQSDDEDSAPPLRKAAGKR